MKPLNSSVIKALTKNDMNYFVLRSDIFTTILW